MECPNQKCEGYLTNQQKSIMDYVKIYDCFICPSCYGEWWPNIEKTGKVTSHDALDALRDEQRRQNAMRKKSSSRKAGRSRKDKKLIITAWWARE